MKTTRMKIANLTQHPYHKKMYSLRHIDDLAESMQRSGLLHPVVITTKEVVLSGWRRILAAKQLGWKEIDVVYNEVPKADEVRLLIDFNRQRVKTILEKWKEIQELKSYWGKKQGERTDKKPGLSNEEKKHTKDRIAAALGISAGNIFKIEKVALKKPSLFTLIDSGEISIHEAYNRVAEVPQAKSVHEITIEPGRTSNSNSEPRPVEKMFTHKCPECGHKFND